MAFVGEVERGKIAGRCAGAREGQVRESALGDKVGACHYTAETGCRETDPFQTGHCDHAGVALVNEYL